MNQYITLAARAELARLLKQRGGVAIQFSAPARGWVEVRVLFAGEPQGPIMLSADPVVLTDLSTLRRLKQAAIDFDVSCQEFVIRLNKDVFHTYA